MTTTQSEPSTSLSDSAAAVSLPKITAEMAHEVAVAQKVCVHPLVRRVIDQATGAESRVAIACNSTQESRCPSCAEKNRRLRMQQCREGWHRSDEPNDEPVDREPSQESALDNDDQERESAMVSKRSRSTRRRDDVPDLPRVPCDERTVGRVFETTDGKAYRPSMFLTVTMPSYGKVKANGAPVDPGSYDYRRAALDALHFPKLVDRLWDHVRRCAGYNVQYFAAVEPQRRLAPHLHAAIRGAIPRAVLRQVVQATYLNVWWPSFDRPVYVHRTPEWTPDGYCDLDTGWLLPTWEEACDAADADSDQRPAHTMRFGSQLDLAGIIAPSADADRAIRYLTKYLAKSISTTYTGSQELASLESVEPDELAAVDVDYLAHVDRLHAELRYLPCSEQCANWLRYGIQPRNAGPGLRAGHCQAKAHDRDHLGIGGRRVLVSRQWSGKSLRQHKVDRAAVVRETLLSSGIVAPEIKRLATTVTLPGGSPRFVWTDTRPDAETYVAVIMDSVIEHTRWRAEYETAKQNRPVDNTSATHGQCPTTITAVPSARPDNLDSPDG